MAEMTDLSASAVLANFAASSVWDDVPAAVRHEGRRAVLNFFAVTLAAVRDPMLATMERIYVKFSSGEQATLIGRKQRSDPLTAAAINAMAANIHDFDDTHHPTIIHPSAPVASALFALAEARPMRGEQWLHAFLIGVEAACRIGRALSPGHYTRGWHVTSTCGVFGAAVGAACALNLDASRIVAALGCAAVQAGGLVEMLGTGAKSVSVGNAARNGLLSALLAAEGLDGPAQPLEGVRGYLRVAADAPDVNLIGAGLGTHWEIINNTYKPYPCGVVLNPVIDACLALTADRRIAKGAWRAIKHVELMGHPLLRQRTDRPGVGTGRQSQVSAQHAVAVTLLRGRAGLAEFSDEAVADPDVQELGQKLKFVDDDTCPVDAVWVTILFGDGTSLQHRVEAARGSLARPLQDVELEKKLRELCRYGGARVQSAHLIDAVWALEAAEDAGAVIRLASG